MPVITIDIGILTKEQKTELLERLTDPTSSITKIPKDAFVVVINELEDANIGIGGRPIGELKQRAGAPEAILVEQSTHL